MSLVPFVFKYRYHLLLSIEKHKIKLMSTPKIKKNTGDEKKLYTLNLVKDLVGIYWSAEGICRDLLEC